jgi:hypothetical protein
MSLSIQLTPVVWNHKFNISFLMQYKSRSFTATTLNIHIINMTTYKGFSEEKK